MKVVVDRFEGEYAICENKNREMISIDKKLLPPNVSEGDVLFVENGEVTIDTKGTRDRKKGIKALMDKLWQ